MGSDNNPTVDAGLVPILVSVGDKVWFDATKNGIQDVAEPAIAGVRLNLLDKDGKQIVLDAEGIFSCSVRNWVGRQQ